MNKTVLALVGVAGLASAASAQTNLATFAFNTANGAFTATSATSGNLVVSGVAATTGNVTRVAGGAAVQGAASYDPGAAAGRLNVNIAVTAVTAANALGGGSLSFSDLNGDTLTANLSGSFINGGSVVFFNGTLSNVRFNNNSGDGLFNGPSGGAFTLSDLVATYTGAITLLELGNVTSFFTQNTGGMIAQVSGAVVPAPSALALLGLGGLVAGRRRR